MQYVTRLADELARTNYPLPVNDQIIWSAAAADADSGQKFAAAAVPATSNDGYRLWQCEIALPEIPAEHIIVPSFACLTDTLGYSFGLHWSAGESHLQAVPAAANEQKAQSNSSDTSLVTTHVDCWHSAAEIKNAKLVLSVYAHECPAQYLLTLSVRAIELKVAAPPRNATVAVPIPLELAQMQAEKTIRARICSPTALAMALSVYDPASAWSSAIEACYDPVTKAYGAWPLAIRWAAKQGTLAAVEAVSSWSTAETILKAGAPLVCSIRFAPGKLHGAPLKSTSGHLVLCYGIEDEHVLVKDPAAASHNEVDRRYRVDEFIQAWLSRRGGTYIFARPTGV